MATQQQPPVTQTHLLTLLEKAIDLYQECQPIKGMLPSAQTLQAMLKTCGLAIDLSYVTMCREITIDARTVRSGQCLECGRTVASLNHAGMCAGCSLEAQIEAQERT